MKYLLSILILTLVSAANAETPLVTKVSGGGFVHPDWISMEKCEVYSDRAVITRRFGGVKTFDVVEVRPLQISEGVRYYVENAKKETFQETPNSLCDGPVTSIYIGAPGADLIFTTGGCGSPRKERQGPFSFALTKVVNAYCPLTHDRN